MHLIRSCVVGHVVLAPNDVPALAPLVRPIAARGRLEALFLNNWKTTACLNLQNHE